MRVNDNTRVVVCCYNGDAHQVVAMMDAYTHHGCPITVMSPSDSAVMLAGVDNYHCGKRAYIGQDCLDRWVMQLRAMLRTCPENWFLIHDSDSIVLDPLLPDYLYEHDVLWSNQINNTIQQQQIGFENALIPHMPRIAMQPPWFMSRRVIERLLSVADDPRLRCNPVLPFIDFMMVGMAILSETEYRALPFAVSCAISNPNVTDAATLKMLGENRPFIAHQVRHNGLNFIHSVKDGETCKLLLDARKEYLCASTSTKSA